MLADRAAVPLTVVIEAARQIEERRLGRPRGPRPRTDRARAARSPTGCRWAREQSLAELLGDWWGPDRPTDLVRLVEELNGELCGSDAERPHDGRPAPRFS